MQILINLYSGAFIDNKGNPLVVLKKQLSDRLRCNARRHAFNFRHGAPLAAIDFPQSSRNAINHHCRVEHLMYGIPTAEFKYRVSSCLLPNGLLLTRQS
ncbi:hypothetical protein [Burkholderia sp. MSMB0856]|uniref:hypothetical protein n=1 Tax=Burkholderia sp. MSMB0856 TaxID=1637869 RepID=UPI00131F2319|nr:hypothetical protein [Burkholderia sp. MSMB0856]